MFELKKAQSRLEAIEQAQNLLDDICEVLCDADVKNTRVAKVVVACRREFTDYQHMTEYAINKREKHAHNQPVDQEGPSATEEEVQSASFGSLPTEEGSLHQGLCCEAEEAQLG